MTLAIFLPDQVGRPDASAADIVGGDSALSDGSDGTFIHCSSDGNFVINDGWVTIPGGLLNTIGTEGVDYTVNSVSLVVRWMGIGPNPLSLFLNFTTYDRTTGIPLTLSGGTGFTSTSGATQTQNMVIDGPVMPYLNGDGLSVNLEAGSFDGSYDVWYYECQVVVDYSGPDLEPPPTVLRRAVVIPQVRVSPSLRMLQRGGQGGMSGIPRMVGNPVRGLRQGPGSVY